MLNWKSWDDHGREAVTEKLEAARARAGELKDSVAGSAGPMLESLAHKAADLAHDLAQRAAHAAPDDWSESAHAARERLAALREAAPARVHAAAQSAAHTAGTLGMRAGQALHDRAARFAPAVEEEVEVAEPQSGVGEKLIWLGLGVVAGVALGVLLAPASGRRSRALVRDKITKAGHEAGDLGVAARKKAADLSHRATGLAHDIKEKVKPSPDDADDATITARVRSELGRLPAAGQLGRLNVDVCEGVATLRGPVVDEATRAAVETAVRGVKGVQAVKSTLLVESGEDETFVG